ncbi:axonemal dynein heavy chain [Thecamonas trahens ATCC 50062]|uniref:Axonemal dynein heavy chain n=1 Tax=Thecamonas trahens ATCC 50062 TaxID=461836 RepID=A0A0L0DLM5_THETB|nr:axonemal dynein heavy chain [Thecamonas trahens ATCC 50062]KNC53150.1 axonemal dynein heavy chain [Thecamonas trahens ATCC 50062]|eukprot:XP_013754623.1 axonemal dynein heavy chain [Thecamonas trahens ATCC 50062]
MELRAFRRLEENTQRISEAIDEAEPDGAPNSSSHGAGEPLVHHDGALVRRAKAQRRARRKPQTLAIKMPTILAHPPARPPLSSALKQKLADHDLDKHSPDRRAARSSGLRYHYPPALPELFDDRTFELYTPDEWLARGGPAGPPTAPHAFSPFLNAAGEYEWHPCDVVDYDPVSNTFTIEFKPSRVTKRVKRLNLLFADEPDANFRHRLLAARAARRSAEATMRYHLVANRLPDEILPPSADTIAAMLRRAAPAFPLSAMSTLEALLDDIVAHYISTMRRAIFGYTLKSSSELRDRLAPLGLPPLPDPPPPPLYGTVPCPPFDLPAAVNWASAQLFFHPRINYVLQTLFTFAQNMDSLCLVDLNLPRAALPLAIGDFEDFQARHADRVAIVLDDWAKKIVLLCTTVLEDEADKTFDFHVAALADLDPHAARFILLLRLIMREHLIVAVNTTAARYAAFFAAYDEPELSTLTSTFLTQIADSGYDGDAGNGLTGGDGDDEHDVDDGNAGDDQSAESRLPRPPGHPAPSRPSARARVRARARDRARSRPRSFHDYIHAISSHTPLFLVSLMATPNSASAAVAAVPLQTATQADGTESDGDTVDSDAESVSGTGSASPEPHNAADSSDVTFTIPQLLSPAPKHETPLEALIRFSPPLTELSARVATTFDTSLSLIDRVTAVEYSLLPRASLSLPHPPPPVFPVDRYDSVLLEATRSVASTFNSGLWGPRRLARLFAPYAYILALTPQSLAATLTSASPPPALADLKALIVKFRAAAANVASTTPDAVTFKLLRVDTTHLKSTIAARAAKLARAVLAFILHGARRNMVSLCAEFEAIHARIQAPAASPEEWAQMQVYCKACDTALTQHAAAIEDLKASMDTLYTFSYPVSATVQSSFVTTLMWPREVRLALVDREVLLHDERNTLLATVAAQAAALNATITSLAKDISALEDLDDISAAAANAATVTALHQAIAAARADRTLLNSRQALFELPVLDFPVLDALADSLEPHYALWPIAAQFAVDAESWLEGSFIKLDAAAITSRVESWSLAVNQLYHHKFGSSPGPAAVARALKLALDDFRSHLSLVNALHAYIAPSDRYWELINERLAGAETPLPPLAPTLNLTLKSLLDADYKTALPDILAVAELAGYERKLQRDLDRMQAALNKLTFDISEHASTRAPVLRNSEAIAELLEDQLIKTQTMRSSPFMHDALERSLTAWEAALNTTQEFLDVCMTVQRSWLYLEPIFGSKDIFAQMPAEGKAFAKVDSMFRAAMKRMANSPEVGNLRSRTFQLRDFHAANLILDDILSKLKKYLDAKCALFPRFFFLSSEELLEILSHTRDPDAVQPHLKKCFENIESLTAAPRPRPALVPASATELSPPPSPSSEGESVPLLPPVVPSTSVESWLSDLETAMRAAVKSQLALSLAASPSPRTERAAWLPHWPGQIVLAVANIIFTEAVESALAVLPTQRDALAPVIAAAAAKLTELIDLVRSAELSPSLAITLQALVTLDVHHRDVLAALDTADSPSFVWDTTLKSYYNYDASELTISILAASRSYGYEYLGNTSRLVITNLTSRCYATLMMALHFNLGGAPQGPAGTGKTETCKDLAKALAKQCVVFNCSEGLNYKAMGKFFKGLAWAGAWACFDEFNRIELSVLSVIASQILTIQHAILLKRSHFSFEGDYIALDPSCAIFTTMNPGYAGRTHLPDNLKALFRPVAMMTPDYAAIAEIILVSFGFADSHTLAAKVTATFRLASEQLSSQHHYDFGLRAVKAVLVAAGALHAAARTAGPPSASVEAAIALQALLDSNMPKFTSDDALLFRGIVSDLFPGLASATASSKAPGSALARALRATMAAAHLAPSSFIVSKALQLHETTALRHGIMLVGASGSGKSTVLNTLATTLTASGSHVSVAVANPKSVSSAHLYGKLDLETREWSDGILSQLVRAAVRGPADTSHWIVLDGPVDPVWIESLNTLLDDNKKLCLSSGEIVKLTSNVTMLFEVDSLAAASPATVSRCGMVYLDAADLGWQVLTDSYVATHLPPALASATHLVARIKALVHSLLSPALSYVAAASPDALAPLDACLQTQLAPAPNALVSSFLGLFDALLCEWRDESHSTIAERDRKTWIESVFVFALVWSLGAAFASASARTAFSDFVRSLTDPYRGGGGGGGSSGSAATGGQAQGGPALVRPFPNDGTVYDYAFSKGAVRWVSFLTAAQDELLSAAIGLVPHSLSPDEASEDQLSFRDIIVPTPTTIATSFVLATLIGSTSPAPLPRRPLVVGVTGTGKSLLVRSTLAHLSATAPEATASLAINFSAHTPASELLAIIAGRLTKARKAVYSPAPPASRLVVFIDDLNFPEPDEYASQPPLELLRQVIDSGGWYAATKAGHEFQTVLGTSFVGAMGPPGGGRHELSPRLLRHFTPVAVPEASTATMIAIFRALSDRYATRFPHAVRAQLNTLVSASVALFNAVVTTFLPTPTKPLYGFNLRDLSALFEGILVFADPRPLDDSQSELLGLWAHEASRVFGDRLVSAADSAAFSDLLATVTREHFKRPLGAVIDELTSQTDGALLYGPLNDAGSYARVAALDHATSTMDAFIADAALTYPNDMATCILHPDALAHVLRAYRVLSRPRGHLLAVGIGAAAQARPLVLLAASVAGYNVFQVQLFKNYAVSDWRERLRELFLSAGLGSTPVVFLLDDAQLVNDTFLEDVNNILNHGLVPNIFDASDMATIRTTLAKSLSGGLGGPPPTTSSVGAAVPGTPVGSAAGGGAGVLGAGNLGVVDESFTDEDALFASMATAVASGGGAGSGSGTVPPAAALTNRQALDMLTARLRASLHLVITLSPTTTSFSSRIRRFPALASCCTVDVYHPLQPSALRTTAEVMLADVGSLPRDDVEPIIRAMLAFHESATELAPSFATATRRQYHVSSVTFRELVGLFGKLYADRRASLTRARERYLTGLEKLAESAATIEVMEQRLQELRPQLQSASRQVDTLLRKLTKQASSLAEAKATVDGAVAEASAREAEAKVIYGECEDALATMYPQLQAANAALSRLKKKHVDEIRTMKNPPEAVKVVMEAVTVLLRVKVKTSYVNGIKVADTWRAAQKMLLKRGFIKSLLEYDADNIPEALMDRVRVILESEHFTLEAITRASVAATSIGLWVSAVEKYHRVVQLVKPRRNNLAAAQAQHASVLGQLNEKRAELDSLVAQQDALQAEYDGAAARKAQLANDVDQCEVQLSRAQRLMYGLNLEKQHWLDAAEAQASALSHVVGDTLLAAACVVYLGPLTSEFRATLQDAFASSLSVAVSPDYSLSNILSSPLEIRAWHSFGLPRDATSTQSALIVSLSRNWPFMIDPQGQAKAWITGLEREAGLVAVNAQSESLLLTLERAMLGGVPTLLYGVGSELDPALDPLLARAWTKIGARTVIQLGAEHVDVKSSFRLYITTSLHNPRLRPELAELLTVVNFAITPTGLADQVLSLAMSVEAPAMEAQNEQLLLDSVKLRQQLSALEDKVLDLLSTSQGNFLEDDVLIETLTDSKREHDLLSVKLKSAQGVRAELRQTRSAYVPLAELAALLFGVLTDLAAVDPMYQFSLDAFTSTTVATLRRTRTSDPRHRLTELASNLRLDVFRATCRSLYERHKLLLALVMAFRVSTAPVVSAASESKASNSVLQFPRASKVGQGLSPSSSVSSMASAGSGDEAGAGARGAFESAEVGMGAELEEDVDVAAAARMEADARLHFLATGMVGLSSEPTESASDLAAQVAELPFLTSEAVARAVQLSQLAPFATLLNHLHLNKQFWRAWMASGTPHSMSVPGPLGEAMSALDTLLLVRALKPEGVVPAVRHYVAEVLGPSFVEPPAFDLGTSFAASSPQHPILFLISPGLNPLDAITSFAHERGMGPALAVYSLGQGQGPMAQAAITAAQSKGTWVVLQNCHLNLEWMPTLAAMLEATPQDVAPGFRLWLTSKSVEAFPVSIALSSVTVTHEAPAGVRASLLASYGKVQDDMFNNPAVASAGREVVFRKLLYGINAFHAVVVERRKFGPLGFTIPYEFSEADLSICQRQLVAAMEEPGADGRIPFEALHYLAGEVNYGGRVTDAHDRRLLAALLRTYFSREALSSVVLPDEPGLAEYVAHIKALPATDAPAVFGLHANAQLTAARNATSELLAAVVVMQPRDEAMLGLSHEEVLAHIVTRARELVPSSLARSGLRDTLTVSYDDTLTTLLLQEMARFDELLVTITDSLVELDGALRGEFLFSARLEKLGEQLRNLAVPDEWLEVSYPTLAGLWGYLEDLAARVAVLRAWARDGPPAVFWLAGLSFPQALLTAVKQDFARSFGVPIDRVRFAFQVLAPDAEPDEPPPSGVYLSGLFLDGGRWDAGAGQLVEQVDGELYPPLPVLWLRPYDVDVEEPTSRATYAAPLYKTAARRGELDTTGHSTNYVVSVDLPIAAARDVEHWVKRGVAIVGQYAS